MNPDAIPTQAIDPVQVVIGPKVQGPSAVPPEQLAALPTEAGAADLSPDTDVAIDGVGGPQTTSVVNESDLFSLVLDSRKPEAKAIRRWLTSEVLPSIRRTGRYDMTQRESALAFHKFLLKLPAPWLLRFEPSFFRAILGVYGYDHIPGNVTQLVGKLINLYIYEPLVAGLSEELKKRRKECGKDSAQLHQFLVDEALPALTKQITKVETIATIYAGSPQAFHEGCARLFYGRDQLLLPLATKPKKLSA